MKNTDLHNHSYYSDGLIYPKQLIQIAKKRGIKNIALTDHNSTKGIQEAIKEGKRIGVNVIPGIEIRCKIGEILGYFIDPKNKELNKEIKKDNKRIQSKVKEICRNLTREGYKLTYEELGKKHPKAKGNLNEFYPIYELYLKKYAKTTFESRKIIWGNKKIRPKKIKEINEIKTIKLIKNAGGVPVLAHPWIDPEALIEKNLKKLIKAGLKGLEINNGDNEKFMRKISKQKNIQTKIRKLAKKYKLIITSGSDYHGEKLAKLMPGNHNLGKNNCDEKVIKQLRSYSN